MGLVDLHKGQKKPPVTPRSEPPRRQHQQQSPLPRTTWARLGQAQAKPDSLRMGVWREGKAQRALCDTTDFPSRLHGHLPTCLWMTHSSDDRGVAAKIPRAVCDSQTVACVRTAGDDPERCISTPQSQTLQTWDGVRHLHFLTQPPWTDASKP